MNCCKAIGLITLLAGTATCRSEPDTTAADQFISLKKPIAIELQAGDTGRLSLQLLIREGYHITAGSGMDNNFLPLQLHLPVDEQLCFGEPHFSAVTYQHGSGLAAPYPIFSGRMEINVPATAGPAAVKGAYPFTARLYYQACSAQQCFFPRTLSVPILITII